MKIKSLIKNKRNSLGESKIEFGNRFNVGEHAVTDWESGRNCPPQVVIEFALEEYIFNKPCMYCKGTGIYIGK